MVGTSKDLMDPRSGFIWKILSFPELTKLFPFPKTHSSHCVTFMAEIDKSKPSFPQEFILFQNQAEHTRNVFSRAQPGPR